MVSNLILTWPAIYHQNRWNDRLPMDTLANRIAEQFKSADYCMVRLEELSRIWPTRELRDTELQDFVTQNGWWIFSYQPNFGAMITRIPPGAQ